MIKINNKKIDILFQVEQDVSFKKIVNNLTLETDNILVVCNSQFFHNIVSDLYDYIDDSDIYQIENLLHERATNLVVKINYKNKYFDFIFLITPSESKIIDVPLKGEVKFDIGFKKTEFI